MRQRGGKKKGKHGRGKPSRSLAAGGPVRQQSQGDLGHGKLMKIAGCKPTILMGTEWRNWWVVDIEFDICICICIRNLSDRYELVLPAFFSSAVPLKKRGPAQQRSHGRGLVSPIFPIPPSPNTGFVGVLAKRLGVGIWYDCLVATSMVFTNTDRYKNIGPISRIFWSFCGAIFTSRQLSSLQCHGWMMYLCIHTHNTLLLSLFPPYFRIFLLPGGIVRQAARRTVLLGFIPTKHNTGNGSCLIRWIAGFFPVSPLALLALLGPAWP